MNKLSYEDRRELKKTEAGIYHIYAEEYWKSDSRDHLTKLKAQRNKILEAAGLAGESKSSNRAKNYIEFSFSEKYLYRYSLSLIHIYCDRCPKSMIVAPPGNF